jgi:serine/threonine-protein kinase RsbW
MSDAVVRLTFPAKADYLLLARLALSGVARNLRIEDDVLADLKLAVTEACGNSVRHAYGPDGGTVSLAFEVGDGRLDVVVEDTGKGIGLHTLDGKTPEELADVAETSLEGGMGMPIIRAIVDELEVTPGADGRGTVVRMVKLLDAPL